MNLLFQNTFDLFDSMRVSALLILPVAFLIRLIINLIFFKGTHGHIELLKDTLICVGLLYFFKDIVEFFLSLSSLVTPYEDIEILLSKGGFMMKIINFIGQLFYWLFIVLFKMILLIIVLCSAYLILFASMTQRYGLLKFIFTALLFLGIWPLICSSIDLSIYKFLTSSENSDTKSYAVIGLAYILKLLSPLFGLALAFKSHSLGRSILKKASFVSKNSIVPTSIFALKTSQTMAQSGKNQLRNTVLEFKRNNFNKSLIKPSFKIQNLTSYKTSYSSQDLQNLKNYASPESLKEFNSKGTFQNKKVIKTRSILKKESQTISRKTISPNIKKEKFFKQKKLPEKRHFQRSFSFEKDKK